MIASGAGRSKLSAWTRGIFSFLLEPLVVYLFNPFSEPTFAQVLENLRQSVEQTPRPIYIAYRFTEFDKLLAQANWLEKIAGSEQWAVYRNRREIRLTEKTITTKDTKEHKDNQKK